MHLPYNKAIENQCKALSPLMVDSISEVAIRDVHLPDLQVSEHLLPKNA